MSETLGQLLNRLHSGMVSFDQLASWYYERGIEKDTLNSEIAALREEVERLSKDRKEVLSYLQAVSNCALQHPEGYTLIDFQQVWLAQKTRENEALRTRVEQAEKELAAEREKSKCNHEWKEWTSTAGRTRQCIKCGQQYSWFG